MGAHRDRRMATNRRRFFRVFQQSDVHSDTPCVFVPFGALASTSSGQKLIAFCVFRKCGGLARAMDDGKCLLDVIRYNLA